MERLESIKKLKFKYDIICDEPVEQYHTNDIYNWEIKTEAPFRDLRQSEISLAYKHILVYKDIFLNRYKNALVLEDDVIVLDDFEEQFDNNLKKTPEWDMIFIGSGCNLSISQDDLIDNQIAYRKSNPASKCTDSYCISGQAASKLATNLVRHSLPIDFELNYWIEKLDFKVYWWEPPLVKQGSQIGIYKSAIQ